MAQSARFAEVPAIQRDWQTREFVEVVKLNLLQIVHFLNKFDQSARFKLSRINEKLHTLERTLEFCEAASAAGRLQGNPTE